MAHRGDKVHITGWPAILLAIVILPIAVPIEFLFRIFGMKAKPKERTPTEVVGFIRDFIEGTGGEWDWDDFTSVPIADTALEVLRREAEMIALPVRPEGQIQLQALLVRAEALKSAWLNAGKRE